METTADTLSDLYQQNYPRLVNIARKQLGSYEEARDAVEDVFLNLSRAQRFGKGYD